MADHKTNGSLFYNKVNKTIGEWKRRLKKQSIQFIQAARLAAKAILTSKKSLQAHFGPFYQVQTNFISQEFYLYQDSKTRFGPFPKSAAIGKFNSDPAYGINWLISSRQQEWLITSWGDRVELKQANKKIKGVCYRYQVYYYCPWCGGDHNFYNSDQGVHNYMIEVIE